MISWRYATAADVDRYYGERPEQTIRAIAVLMDDEPVGMLGLEHAGDRFIAFSEFKPELEPLLKSIPVMRAVKAAQRMFQEAPLPVIVVNTSNPPLLERLGFVEIQKGVHLCRS
jgi:hypothetical protein